MTRNIKEKVINLRKFFEVYHLNLLNESKLAHIACRRLGISEKADYALLAWAQKAKLEARTITVSPINLRKLKSALSEIRKMTLMAPEVFCKKLRQILSECGIALVFLPHIGGSFLHGATFYDMNKIVIGLTVRGKDVDKFWFSLFHELGHIILGHINKPEELNEEDEKAADTFARDVLIPESDFTAFKDRKQFTRESIAAFAKKVTIDTGIVVGRLQKENHISFNMFNDMKQRYSLAE